jgi:hypothetical protein
VLILLNGGIKNYATDLSSRHEICTKFCKNVLTVLIVVGSLSSQD